MTVQTPTTNSLQLPLETLQKALAGQSLFSVDGVHGDPTNPQPHRPVNPNARIKTAYRFSEVTQHMEFSFIKSNALTGQSR